MLFTHRLKVFKPGPAVKSERPDVWIAEPFATARLSGGYAAPHPMNPSVW
jgi:hypothetical protein